MVAENLHLRFLPRSLLLNLNRNNNTTQSNPRPDDYEKKRKRDSNSQPCEEEQNVKMKKKKKKKKRKRNDKGTCEDSAELEGVIAEFLRRKGLYSTLSIFLSEKKTEVSVKAHKLKLEDIYHCYCHQICKSPIKENMEEGKFNRESSFGKLDADRQLNGENIKIKDKGKSRKDNDACAANICMRTPNDSSEGEDLRRNDKTKTFGTEAVDYFSRPAKKKKTKKGKRNDESVIETYKSNAKNSFTSNEEKVLDHADPLYKSLKPKGKKKKKASSDEMKLTDNYEKNCFKRSKKTKRNADLVHDPVNLENNVFKKEKRKKKEKSDVISEELGYINEKKTMTVWKQLATGSNTANKESNIESVEDPSEYLGRCLNSEQLKKESSSEMTLGGNKVQNNEKRNKKEKQALEKLQPTFMHSTNQGAKGMEKNLSEDIENTQSITKAYRAFKADRDSIDESVTLKKGSTDNISHSCSTLLKKDGAKETKEHASPDLNKYKQSKSCIVNFVDPRLGDNSS